MITKLKKREKRDTLQNVLFSFLIGALFLLMIGFLIFQNLKINQKRDKLTDRIEALKKQVEELEEKKEFLKTGISQIGSEEYIEKIAREELNFQKEGEKAVAFVLPEQNQQEEEKKEEENFWNIKGWWQWLKNKF